MSLAVPDTSFYVVANYKTSQTTYFPDNKPQHFHVKLSKPLDFTDSGWKVALCEIVLKDVLPIPIEGESYPSLYSIAFGDCDGIYINGKTTHSLRVIPNTSDKHIVFTKPFYLPVQAEYIETFEISINNLQQTPLTLHLSESTLITCTLHFRKD